jgi:uncharacterized protein (TIGR04255 family)
MGSKMSDAPVYYAIIQAKFNQILALDSYAPPIQDSFRREGFPDAHRGTLSTFNLTMDASADSPPAQVPVAQVARYSFLNIEKTAGFILDQGAISFQTTDYDVFETFSEKFLRGLEIVNKAVDLSFTDRIGIRYLDAIFPKSDDKLSDYLNECVHGLSEKSSGQIAHSFNETVWKIDDVSITSRAIIQGGPLGFPPDLMPCSLAVLDRFEPLTGMHAVLDIDGSIERRDAFNIDLIRNRISSIHGEVERAFKATVTKHALKVWL